MTIYFLILIVMTLIGAVASFFLKKASGADGIISMLKNINLYIGAMLYLTSAVLNIFILRYIDYSVVLPLTSITYIWTMFLSYFLLKEKITTKKIAGLLLIVFGSILVSFKYTT